MATSVQATCHLRATRQRCRSDVNVLFRQVRQSDRHRDAYSHLHVDEYQANKTLLDGIGYFTGDTMPLA